MDIVIGNSSSGLLEHQQFKYLSEMGEDKRGRLGKLVMTVGSESEIVSLMNSIFSKKISMNESDFHNPYGMGAQVKKIVNILEEIEIEYYKIYSNSVSLGAWYGMLKKMPYISQAN